MVATPLNFPSLPEGVTADKLQKVRITQMEFVDGTVDVEQDEWGETPRGGKIGKKPKSKKAWRGSTWFFLEGAHRCLDRNGGVSTIGLVSFHWS